jgi:ribosomal-protein-alanine N-acetyltransferase
LIITTTPFPTLSTERLTLRALTSNDRHELLRLRSDEQVNRHLERTKQPSLVDVDKFIQKIDSIVKNNEGVYWAISLKDIPGLIGTICYWNFDFKDSRADLGYELLPAFQDKGMMQEALVEVTRYGFEIIGLKTILAMVHPKNQASIKLLERNGFVLDGDHKLVSKENAGAERVYFLSA